MVVVFVFSASAGLLLAGGLRRAPAIRQLRKAKLERGHGRHFCRCETSPRRRGRARLVWKRGSEKTLARHHGNPGPAKRDEPRLRHPPQPQADTAALNRPERLAPAHVCCAAQLPRLTPQPCQQAGIGLPTCARATIARRYGAAAEGIDPL